MSGAAGNAREGASLLQVADKGLDAIKDALVGLKALATSASSTTAPLSRAERGILNSEFQDLRAEIDRIAETTEFDGTKVLKGIQITFKVGTGAAQGDDITLDLAAATAAGLSSGLATDDITTAPGASQALTNVTNAIDALADIESKAAAAAVRFRGAEISLALNKASLDEVRVDQLARPGAADSAQALANLVSEQILAESAPVLARQASKALGDLLLSARLRPSQPARVPDRTARSEEQTDRPEPRPAPRPAPERADHDSDATARPRDTQPEPRPEQTERPAPIRPDDAATRGEPREARSDDRPAPSVPERDDIVRTTEAVGAQTEERAEPAERRS